MTPNPGLTPEQVVEELRNGSDHARAVLRARLAVPLCNLVAIRSASGLIWANVPARLPESLFCWVEALLLRDGNFPPTDWPSFDAWVTHRVSSLQVGEASPMDTIPPAPVLLPDTFPGYRVGLHYRPLEAVSGDRVFWCQRGGFGWVLLCDVTGHGWPAHIVAEILGPLWGAVSESETTPGGVLNWMNGQLCDRLPESTFVEALLVRIGPEGALSAASAGKTLFERIPGGDMCEGGQWLGFGADFEATQWQSVLAVGEHCLLSTDGFPEQPTDVQRRGTTLPRVEHTLTARLAAVTLTPETVLPTAVRWLEEAILAHRHQHDDVTIVALSRVV